MFEKEAEIKLSEEEYKLAEEVIYPLFHKMRQNSDSLAKYGVECYLAGLNKANEWHYVKDGDLPKDEDWKWCVSYRGYCYVAKYEEMFGCWTNQEYSEVMQPYAWKEIVLPKEIE